MQHLFISLSNNELDITQFELKHLHNSIDENASKETYDPIYENKTKNKNFSFYLFLQIKKKIMKISYLSFQTSLEGLNSHGIKV